MSATTARSKVKADYEIACCRMLNKCIITTIVYGSNNRSQALTAGMWRMSADATSRFKQGDSTVDLAPDNRYFLPGGQRVFFYVTGNGDAYISVTKETGGTAKLYLSKLY